MPTSETNSNYSSNKYFSLPIVTTRGIVTIVTKFTNGERGTPSMSALARFLPMVSRSSQRARYLHLDTTEQMREAWLRPL